MFVYAGVSVEENSDEKERQLQAGVQCVLVVHYASSSHNLRS